MTKQQHRPLEGRRVWQRTFGNGRFRIGLVVLVTFLALVYVFNASWRVAPPDNPGLEFIAHRGVHQTYHREDLDDETCTATRIDEPRHSYLENTIPSIAAAFDAGAAVVEIDVHPTTDGHFAVFHDWTIDCRTEGQGVTREQSLAYLKSLDAGYGYTADGTTYPLRGTGVGQIPELGEVFSAFPDGQFLVNFKSREAREGDMLSALLVEHPEWRPLIWGAYGGDEPTFRAADLIGLDHAWSRKTLIDCLGQYLAAGWTGFMPGACQNAVVTIPINVAPFLWGWPDLLQQRFRDAGSTLVLLGPLGAGDTGTAGIDSAEVLASVPPSFDGYVWTNRVEEVGGLRVRP